jgi:hypothetical protein
MKDVFASNDLMVEHIVGQSVATIVQIIVFTCSSSLQLVMCVEEHDLMSSSARSW